MDQETRRLLNELQGTINKALLGSARFVEMLGLLEESGHDVLISVDASIDGIEGPEGHYERHVPARNPAELHLNSEDQEFLRAMKIDV